MYTWLQALEMVVNGTPMCVKRGKLDCECDDKDYYMDLKNGIVGWHRKRNDAYTQKVGIVKDFIDSTFVPYVKKVKLTDDEKVILRNLPEEYKWIVRDSIDNAVFVAKEKPKKNPSVLLEWDCSWERYVIIPYSHLFQQIKWEDAEPTLIAELLKE